MGKPKCRPMLFSGPLVRAILEGRKTVTRRPVKDRGLLWERAGHTAAPDPDIDRCPHGSPKDRIWVRETFCVEHQVEGVDHAPPHDDGRPVRWIGDEHDGRTWEQAHYRATDPAPELVVVGSDGEERPGCRWCPSIFLPRWASRLTLEVTGVRAERVQGITEEQALAEGVLPDFTPDFDAAWLPRTPAAAAFANAWQRMYAKREGLGWDANPWVWVVEFEVVPAGGTTARRPAPRSAR